MSELFKIASIDKTDNSAKAIILLDVSHPIFKGHFPGQPVVPGVCMMQMVEILLQRILNQPVSINKASTIKFLSVIDPSRNPEINLDLDYSIEQNNTIKITAKISKDEVVFFKFKGEGR